MKCRQCGIEIADKAIVCYKCGTATTEAKYTAPAARGSWLSRNLVSGVLALALLVLGALYAQGLMTGGAPDARRWVIVVLVAAIVARRLIARRGKR